MWSIFLFLLLRTCAANFNFPNLMNEQFTLLGFKDVSNKFILWESYLQKRFDSEIKNDLCIKHLEKVRNGLQDVSNNLWAVKMFDSWAKVPPGILFGNQAELGNFEECMEVKKNFQDDAESLSGKYCQATVNISGFLTNEMTHMPSENAALLIGICLPESCDSPFVNKILHNFFKNIFNISKSPILIEEKTCTKNSAIKFTPWDLAAISLFSLMGLMMLFSSIYDYVMHKLGKRTIPIFVTFSILTNGAKLFKTQRGTYPDVIECLNGIRSLSIIWVVFGHTYLILIQSPNINSVFLLDWLKSYHSSLILSATISVDSFFLLSGFLVAWIIFGQLSKSGWIHVPMMYLHRFLRLVPLLAATILFTVTLLRFLGSGPFWDTAMKGIAENCDRFWWSSLLFVQNYVNPLEMCLGHTWYLSVDTQLYIIAPLILIPLWKWGIKFGWIIPILILLSNAYVISIVLNWEITMKLTQARELGNAKMRLSYFPTHARYSPWLVGVLLAYYLYLNKDRRVKLPKYLALIGWVCALTVVAAIIFGPHDAYLLDSKATILECALYEGFSRVSWSIALAWIIFACTQGYGDVVNTFLSLPIWQVLSRLSYSIYMTHALVQLAIEADTKVSKHISDFEFILQFWGHFGITLTVSIITVLAFESPIVQLEKIIFFKSKRKENNIASQENLVTNDILIKNT